jgi:hypothetical protein
MVNKPDWLPDKPVEIDVHSLSGFGSKVQAELDQNVAPSLTKILDHLVGGPQQAGQRTFGVDSRYQQGAIIGNYHSECTRRAQNLLQLFQVGMAAIAAAAQSIAQDYQSADDLNQMDLNKVDGYFHPTDRSRSLAAQQPLQSDSGSTVDTPTRTGPVMEV